MGGRDDRIFLVEEHMGKKVKRERSCNGMIVWPGCNTFWLVTHTNCWVWFNEYDKISRLGWTGRLNEGYGILTDFYKK